MSLLRYDGPYAQGKVRILYAEHEDLETACHSASERFLIYIGKGPTEAIEALANYVYKKE